MTHRGVFPQLFGNLNRFFRKFRVASCTHLIVASLFLEDHPEMASFYHYHYHYHYHILPNLTSVSISRQKHREHVFYFLQKTAQQREGKQLVYFDHQNVNSLRLCHPCVSSQRQFCVSTELWKHDFKPISMHIFLGLFSNC